MLLILNWKMHPETLKEAQAIFEETCALAGKARGIKIVVAPPLSFLPLLAAGYRGRALSFSAQNIHAARSGAHTGEVSAVQMGSLGVDFTLIGHAERRAMGETDVDVQKKVRAALDASLKPIICIGEKMRDASGEYLELVKRQIETALASVEKKRLKDVVIAYEPVWAIGALEPMRPTQMHEMTIYIRKVLWERYGKQGLSIPILYGGAVLDGVQAAALAREAEVNGFLLGRSSVDPEKLKALFAALSKKP